MRQPERRFRAHRYAEMSARMTFLTRIDPTRNIDRFYVVQVLPTLYTRATTTQCRIARRSHVTELPSRQLVGC